MQRRDPCPPRSSVQRLTSPLARGTPARRRGSPGGTSVRGAARAPTTPSRRTGRRGATRRTCERQAEREGRDRSLRPHQHRGRDCADWTASRCDRSLRAAPHVSDRRDSSSTDSHCSPAGSRMSPLNRAGEAASRARARLPDPCVPLALRRPRCRDGPAGARALVATAPLPPQPVGAAATLPALHAPAAIRPPRRPRTRGGTARRRAPGHPASQHMNTRRGAASRASGGWKRWAVSTSIQA